MRYFLTPFILLFSAPAYANDGPAEDDLNGVVLLELAQELTAIGDAVLYEEVTAQEIARAYTAAGIEFDSGRLLTDPVYFVASVNKLRAMRTQILNTVRSFAEMQFSYEQSVADVYEADGSSYTSGKEALELIRK
jgi:hypothetical protein